MATQLTIAADGAEHQVVPALTIRPNGREQEIAYVPDLGVVSPSMK